MSQQLLAPTDRPGGFQSRVIPNEAVWLKPGEAADGNSEGAEGGKRTRGTVTGEGRRPVFGSPLLALLVFGVLRLLGLV